MNPLFVPGDPLLDWLKAMEAEHCRRADSHTVFKTSNYGIETTAANEWAITLHQQESLADMRHSRRLPSIAALLQSDEAKKAKLSEPEVIAVVLYTGPMVRHGCPSPASRACSTRCAVPFLLYSELPASPLFSS